MPSFPRLAVLLLAVLRAASAGEHFATRSWETDEGLPHNGVNAIHQRPDGFLWVATQGGLVRFDGIDFVQRRSPLGGRFIAGEAADADAVEGHAGDHARRLLAQVGLEAALDDAEQGLVGPLVGGQAALGPGMRAHHRLGHVAPA